MSGKKAKKTNHQSKTDIRSDAQTVSDEILSPAEETAQTEPEQNAPSLSGTEEPTGTVCALDASLDAMTDEDIVPGGAKRRYHSTGWYVNRVMFAVCIAVLGWCVWNLVGMLRGYETADDIYNSAAGEFYAGIDEEHRPVSLLLAAPPSAPSLSFSEALKEGGQTENPLGDISYNPQFELLRANLLNLKRKNKDLYGWISIADTNIDYPIMQGSDNEYYLNHAYTGDFVPAGSIFADCLNAKNLLDNHNLVLYGHNMSNGAMFNNVGKFLDPAFFDSHPYIVVTTLDGMFTYEVFAVYQTTMDYKYVQTQFATHDDFVVWAQEMQANSVNVRRGITFDQYDRVLTLSTCTPSGGYWRNRYTLQAKLIKVELGNS